MDDDQNNQDDANDPVEEPVEELEATEEAQEAEEAAEADEVSVEAPKAAADVDAIVVSRMAAPQGSSIAPIVDEMKRSYLNYAMSVIVARALPDVRDGLKPVHRRILFAMHRLGLHYRGRFSKSAKVVGEVLGKYHPHGDAAVYDAMVRMGQTFSMRYPLILGQGNFGSVDGDPPAAMRYTEAKLSAIAEELLLDIDKDTVAWRDNFDGTLQEPAYVPAKLPNLLLMGAEGIAVGMATKIPPHNLTEVIDAIGAMIAEVSKLELKEGEEVQPHDSSYTYQSPIDEKISQSIVFNTSLDTLMDHVKGPDFPTYGNIYGIEEIKRAYATGKGRVLIRATVEHEETNRGREAIVIKELPYQVNKANLVMKIADLVRDKKIIGISDLRDESDRDGIRVVIELKRDAVYKKLLNNLYKHTELQTSFSVNMVVLVNNTPQTVSLKTILEEYLKHRISVIGKRSMNELEKAKLRAHILEGLLKALDHIDEIIAIIKKAKTETDAKDKLMSTFEFSDIQAQAILDMQLKRLTGLERQKLEDELKILHEQIAYLEGLLNDVFKIMDVIKAELAELREKFGDERRTKIFKHAPGEFTDEQLIENKEAIVTLTQEGYIKTVPMNTFKLQHRGGKGVSGFTTKEEDNVALIKTAETHDYILFFTNKGKVYQTRVWEIPEGSRTSKGKALVNLIALQPEEEVTSILTYKEADLKENNKTFILMCTRLGTIKKTELGEFKNIRASGIIAVNLQKDDQLLWAKMTDNNKKVILAAQNGQSITFNETDVRPTGRSSQGVIAMKLDKGDVITSMDVFSKDEEVGHLLVLSEKGIGKKTLLKLFPLQKRGGKGVKIASIDAKTGKIAFSSVVDTAKETLVMTSKKGLVVKISVKDIPALSRSAKGVILMRFNNKEDAVVSATFL